MFNVVKEMCPSRYEVLLEATQDKINIAYDRSIDRSRCMDTLCAYSRTVMEWLSLIFNGRL